MHCFTLNRPFRLETVLDLEIIVLNITLRPYSKGSLNVLAGRPYHLSDTVFEKTNPVRIFLWLLKPFLFNIKNEFKNTVVPSFTHLFLDLLCLFLDLLLAKFQMSQQG